MTTHQRKEHVSIHPPHKLGYQNRSGVYEPKNCMYYPRTYAMKERNQMVRFNGDLQRITNAPLDKVRVWGDIAQNIIVAEHLSLDEKKKFGIVVAGNSGLPGGGLCSFGPENDCTTHYTKHHKGVGLLKSPFRLKTSEIKPHKTQEESVVSNWLFSCAKKMAENEKRHQRQMSSQITYQDVKANFPKLGKIAGKTICGSWGLRNNREENFDTIQMMQYQRNQHPHPNDFNDCWVVRNTCVTGEVENYYEMLSPVIDIGGLFFVAAPNSGSRYNPDNNKSPSPWGSMTRTYCETGAQNPHFFWASVKSAMRGAIDSAIQEQQMGNDIKYLIFNKLGGGVYKPPGFDKNTDDYVNALNEIMDEEIVDGFTKPYQRKFFFKGVYLCDLDNAALAQAPRQSNKRSNHSQSRPAGSSKRHNGNGRGGR